MNAIQRIDHATIISYIDRLGIRVFDFINHLTKADLVGAGTVMNVYEGYLRANGKEPIRVALKEPRMPITSRTRDNVINNMLDDIRQELRMMKHLEAHPYIVHLYGIAFQDLKPILVVEFAVSTLPDYLYERKEDNDPVDWPTKSRICSEIADGLYALHQDEIVHGDVKGDNILLFPEENDQKKLIAKISDFGFSSTNASIRKGGRTGMTPIFCAPECTQYAPENTKIFDNEPTIDNYSYGFLVWQVAKDGDEPFSGMDNDNIDKLKHSDKELNVLMTQLDDKVPNEFRTLISGMTRYYPADRTSLADARDILKMNDDTTYDEAKTAFEISAMEPPSDLGVPTFNSIQLMALSTSVKSKIVRSYENLALIGDAEAACFLSICYGSGFGIKMDKEKMVSWAVKAAENGNLEAVKIIASHYQTYRDLSDYATFLFPWFQKAAEAGHPNSMLQVADCYWDGIGVEKNTAKYSEWFKKYFDSSKEIVPSQQSPIQSALHRAAREGRLEIIKFILQNESPDINQKDSRGRTPLHWAAEGGHLGITQILLTDFDADVDITDNDGKTPLHSGASNGHIGIVNLLVEKFGADVNAKDNNNWTPLHSAAINKHIEIMKFLVIEFGANVNAKDKDGQTPLHLAIKYGEIESVRFLLTELGSDVNAIDDHGDTPLHSAARSGDIDIVKLLMKESNIDVNAKDKGGQTPLHLAALHGQIHVVRLLIEFGADVNAKDDDSWTPLHSAVNNKRVEIIKVLAIKVADVNTKDEDGETPLHLATRYGEIEIVKLLVIEFGATVNIVDNDRQTPLHFATKYEHIELIKLFVLEFGANVNAKDNNGQTPLHLAAGIGHIEVIELLVGELGADKDITDNQGQTPSVISIAGGHIRAIIALLGQSHNAGNMVDEK